MTGKYRSSTTSSVRKVPEVFRRNITPNIHCSIGSVETALKNNGNAGIPTLNIEHTVLFQIKHDRKYVIKNGKVFLKNP